MKKKIALYITEGEKSIQYRYRCENVRLTLEESKKWEIKVYLISELDEVEKELEDVSLVVIERQSAKENTLIDLIKKIRMKKIPVLFDLDDLVFDFRDLPILMWSTNSKNVFYWGAYFWIIKRVAKRVDGFLATNEFLGEKLKRSFGKAYQVIPNSLNQKQVKVSEKYAKNKKWEGFKIGYFSGSPTHTKDFRLIEAELIRFLNDHDDVILKVVGRMEFSSEMKKWIKIGRVEVMAPVDYLELQKLVAEVDVSVAPLAINDFTNCKSELKFFEAAAVETTTIASPTYTFRKAIDDGKNGFLAKPGEWYDKLEYLYERPKENQKIAKQAKEYALRHYYGEEFLKEVEEAYDYFAK